MSIKRYIASKDNTITNAYRQDLEFRASGSNMGQADSLEVFSIQAQAASGSNEQTKVLVQFPVLTSDNTSSIQGDRSDGTIPASGSVDFYLRLFNVVHDQSIPKNFTAVVSPISQSWEEGNGLDMDEYRDLTYDGTGSNWINSKAHTTWKDVYGVSIEGGSFLSSSEDGSPISSYNEFNAFQTFTNGTEDLEVKITGLVEKWIAGDYSNYGVGIYLTGSQLSGSNLSYYTKKFSARGSEFVLKKPIIEARWNNTRKDHRGNYYVSSSALTSADNKQTLYLYNYIRGELKDLKMEGTDQKSIYVSLWTSASGGDQLTTTPDHPVTGGWIDTGVYTASFALNTTRSIAYDRWYSGSSEAGGVRPSPTGLGDTGYMTGTLKMKSISSQATYFIPRYVNKITNLQSDYNRQDMVRMRLFTRLKDWNPTIYTVASKEIENYFVEDAYYKVYRVVDDFEVVRYGTGSLKHTQLSYDASGSYFDLDMSLFEPGYEYAVKLNYYVDNAYREQPETFKFRVIE